MVLPVSSFHHHSCLACPVSVVFVRCVCPAYSQLASQLGSIACAGGRDQIWLLMRGRRRHQDTVRAYIRGPDLRSHLERLRVSQYIALGGMMH
jgi:hypothetical protein